MAVGIHAAGGHQPSLGIDDLSACRGLDFLRHLKDLPVVSDQNAALGEIFSHHGLDMSVLNQQHMSFLLYLNVYADVFIVLHFPILRNLFFPLVPYKKVRFFRNPDCIPGFPIL